MPGIVISGLDKSFVGKQRVKAVDDLELRVEEGELLVLLGPSGCGKTTTLRCVAGLEEADTGTIAVGGRTVFDRASRISVPPAKRDIGMVFQSYALWPHKTVRANIAYPLRARRMRQALADGWVEAAAALVDCGHLLERYPSQLSGGQQQRVALARGLAARPGIVLFDEPLSNLDAKLRDQVRGELHALHRQLQFTGMYVTHDQQEALAIGDRLAVMRNGRIEQVGTPREVFDRPQTEYVADFIGYANRVVLDWAGETWTTAAGVPRGCVPAKGDVDRLVLRIRPEDVHVLPVDASPEGMFCLAGVHVVDASFAGRSFVVLLAAGDAVLRASAGPANGDHRPPEPGMPVTVAVDAARVRVYDETGMARATAWEPGAAPTSTSQASR